MKRLLLFTWVSHCLLVLALGASAVDRVDAVGKVVRKPAPGHSQINGAGVESRLDPVDRVEVLRLNRGSERASLRHAVGADAALIRAKLKLSGLEPGFGPLLRLGSLELAAQFEGGFWSFYVREDDAGAWVRADFGLGGAEVPFWLNLDVVRYGEEGRSAVFVNGAPITGLLSSGGEGLEAEVSVLQLDFAVVDVSEWAEGSVPDFAWRHFYGERAKAAVLNAGEGASTEASSVEIKDEDLSDGERKALGHFSLFEKRAKAGELSFTEEAWFLTETLNRQYFYGEDAFRVEAALEDASLLIPWGGDYVPTLESRGWTEPWSYENYGDNYIERLYGYLVPEVSGEYHFFVSGDDAAVLYLSESGEVSGLRAVASVLEPTGRYDWGLRPGQRSEGIELKAGEAYYLELWHVETTGGDHVSVSWSLPGSAGVLPDELVPGRVLSSYGGGEPGTYPREVVMKDASFLELPEGTAFESSALVEMTIIGGNKLRGDTGITDEDFNAVNTLFHCYETGTGGLQWLNSNASNFPWIWSYSFSEWIYYQGITSNPQWFKRDNGIWLSYYDSTLSYNYSAGTVPEEYDFESGLEGWSSSPSNWWKRATSAYFGSCTGPSSDHTTGSGYLVYFDTNTGYATTSGSSATLTSPWIETPAGGAGLLFAYHMYGYNMGTLQVEVRDLEGSWTNVWSVTGEQHSSQSTPYTVVDLDLSSYSSDYVQVRFKGVAAGGPCGRMAIDDVYVHAWGLDSDGDGLWDSFEWLTGTNPGAWDSDSDSLSDAAEDSDGDGMSNLWEVIYDLDPSVNDGSGDLDGDGFSNLTEYGNSTDPTVSDTSAVFFRVR